MKKEKSKEKEGRYRRSGKRKRCAKWKEVEVMKGRKEAETAAEVKE